MLRVLAGNFRSIWAEVPSPIQDSIRSLLLVSLRISTRLTARFGSKKHVFSEPSKSCPSGSLNQHFAGMSSMGFSEPRANAVSLYGV